jgi:hypothetical protein
MKKPQAVVAPGLDQNPTPEIMGLRNSCSSTGCGTADMVPDRSGRYSRGQQMFQIGCVPEWNMVVAFDKAIPKGSVAKLLKLGGKCSKNALALVGTGLLSKGVRDEIHQLATAGVTPTTFAAEWSLAPIGYNGIRNLGLALRDSAPINKMFGLSHDLGSETITRLEAARTLAEVPAAMHVPTQVLFTGEVAKPNHVFAMHRLVNAYVGRSGFSRTSPNLKREASASSAKKHLNGSQGWLRIFKDGTVRGDDIATDVLNARVHRALNPDS